MELRRNPSGVVDKRGRATLRPMSKNRRDSSVCELEQRLRDVKSTNCKFRKALMEREAELQALIRKLGPEARAWLDTTLQAQQKGVPPDSGSKERLSVPPIRRELPSTTELTILTSICSIASTQNELDPLTPSQRYMRIYLYHEYNALNRFPISPSHPYFNPTRKRVATISSGSDVPITQPLLQQQQRVTSTGTLTDDLRPQSILKQQQPTQTVQAVQTESVYPPTPVTTDRRSLYSSNKSLNEYSNGSVGNVTNCQQHTPKCATPVRHHDQESFTDNLRQASLITHSSSDLNQMCPHGKGSSKSE